MTSSSEKLEEGESNPCDVHIDCGSSQGQDKPAVKSLQRRFHWSEDPSKSQEQSSRRRSESMGKHGWTTQEGQPKDKGKPVDVPSDPRPLRFQRS